MERPTATGILLRTTGSVATRLNLIAVPMSYDLEQIRRSRFCASLPVSRRAQDAGPCFVWAWMVLASLLSGMTDAVWAADQSPPPILQWFESSYRTIEERAARRVPCRLRVRLDSPAVPCRPG